MDMQRQKAGGLAGRRGRRWCRAVVFATALALGEGALVADAWARPPCGAVEVVDQNGRPVSGATVTHHRADPSGQDNSPDAASWETGRNGRVCEARLLEPGFLEVHAPLGLGGACVARETVRYAGPRPSAGAPRDATRVTLQMRRLRRVTWRGRVVGSDGRPVKGARILVRKVLPEGVDCRGDAPHGWYTAAADGTFQLEPLPTGTIDVLVQADGFAAQAFEVGLPGPRKDLTIGVGGEWSGRLLDPDGNPIRECSMRLEHVRDHINLEATCGPQGFAFHHVPAGDLELAVHVSNLPWSGQNRGLTIPVHFANDEQRRDDVHWPAGLDVSGLVVDEKDAPVAGAYLKISSQDRKKFDAEGAIETRSDGQGRFTYRHLAAGPWTLMASRDLLYGTMSVAAGAQGQRIVIRPQKEP